MISLYQYCRKATHVFSLIIPISYYYFITEKSSASITMALLTLIFIFIDYFRLKLNFIRRFFALFFNKMLKDHELKGKFTGATWVMISSTLVIAIFPKNIAVISLIFMSIGDTVAGLFGKNYGRIKIGRKTLEGFLAGLSSCLIIAYLYKPLPLQITASGAFFGMLIETLPLPLDDNLKIPIISSLAMSLLMSIN